VTESAFGTLRGFIRRPAPIERCELCNAALPPEHQHLIEPVNRKLSCACEACALLFPTHGEKKYKRVPRRIRYLAEFQLTDSQWDSLMMPINMAFFFESTPQARVIALYPSPAGATESLLALDSWEEIVRDNPALEQMEADVEALLVNRIGHARGYSGAEYYLAPIDECFKLVGLIRSRWQGLSGGAEVWQRIAEFFAGLKAKSPPRAAAPVRVGENAHA
jgi:hypothetical protein